MYLITIPKIKISPIPSIEHYYIGESYYLLKDGLNNFIGSSNLLP